MERHPASTKAIDAAKVALRQIAEGDVYAGLLSHELAETGLLEISTSSDQLHTLLWILMTRGAVLVKIARLDEAQILFERVIQSARTIERSCQVVDSSCFSQEVIQASISLAAIRCNRGDIPGSVEQLLGIQDLVPDIGHEPFQSTNETVSELVRDYANVLGHKLTEKDIVLSIGGEPSPDTSNHATRWQPPDSLGGRATKDYTSAYDLLSAALDEASRTERDLLLQQIDTLLCEWLDETPFSMEVRVLQIVNALMTVTNNCGLGDTADIETRVAYVIERLVTLLPNITEYVDSKRQIARCFCELARVLAIRGFEENSRTREQEWRVAGTALSWSMSLLENSRQTAPVTTAVALVECATLNMAVVLNEMGANTDMAEKMRITRDTILTEILRLDPANDQALRRLRNIEAVSQDSDPEVLSWKWNVHPEHWEHLS